MNKFHAVKVKYNGMVFDSKHEFERYLVLADMQKRGQIKNLQRQVTFELVPNQRTVDGRTLRSVKYIADFVYEQKNGMQIVEDAKGVRTREYQIKKKLMLSRYGILIKEV